MKFRKLPPLHVLHTFEVAAGNLSFKLTAEQLALTPSAVSHQMLALAQQNTCEYCLSAHTAIGKMVGLNENEIVSSRRASSDDAKTNAALSFAHQIVVKRGEVDDADVRTVRAAGFGDGEITEIIANVALNIFTNYFNHIALQVVTFITRALDQESRRLPVHAG